MLVLSRKSEESVVIGGSDGLHRLVKVTVLGIKGANVKLGFEADADVPVHRSEVWERINGNGLAGEEAGRPRRAAYVMA
jgi:carbon storage regulator